MLSIALIGSLSSSHIYCWYGFGFSCFSAAAVVITVPTGTKVFSCLSILHGMRIVFQPVGFISEWLFTGAI
ncbi:unnamed protein product [Dracunculus medinensis]|uniref:Secreted protein n=1 Tax=Dracunculus medinensis TaxID=318479 RepID=A0A0N4US09_DRAME|nr:unnamed protein product [Dracunculus medinensis]